GLRDHRRGLLLSPQPRPRVAARQDRAARARRGDGQPRDPPRLRDPRRLARPLGAAAESERGAPRARGEPRLRNRVPRPPRVRIPGSPLLVEQQRVRLDQLDAPRPPHQQPPHVAPRDPDRPRVVPLQARRGPPLPRRAPRRRLLVLHRDHVDPALRRGLPRAEDPVKARTSARRGDREDLLLWLELLAPIAAWI